MILIICTFTLAQIPTKESTKKEGVRVFLQTRRLESTEEKERKTAAVGTNQEDVRTNGTVPGSLYRRICPA